jgi:hypothetical protein
MQGFGSTFNFNADPEPDTTSSNFFRNLFFLFLFSYPAYYFDLEGKLLKKNFLSMRKKAKKAFYKCYNKFILKFKCNFYIWIWIRNPGYIWTKLRQNLPRVNRGPR